MQLINPPLADEASITAIGGKFSLKTTISAGWWNYGKAVATGIGAPSAITSGASIYFYDAGGMSAATDTFVQRLTVVQGVWAWDNGIGQNFPYGNGLLNTSHANGDAATFPVYLEAGTYNFKVLYQRSDNQGIMEISIDGTPIGTIDFYGALQANTAGSITGVVVAASGTKTIRLKVLSKNAGSSDYYLSTNDVLIERTV